MTADLHRIYADHASTTQPSPEVVAAMLPWLSERFGNASSVHSRGEAAHDALEAAVRKGGDTGAPVVAVDPTGETSRAFKTIAGALAQRISIATIGASVGSPVA